jgi:hypothetical protein
LREILLPQNYGREAQREVGGRILLPPNYALEGQATQTGVSQRGEEEERGREKKREEEEFCRDEIYRVSLLYIFGLFSILKVY